jgi:hypothetical protein
MNPPENANAPLAKGRRGELTGGREYSSCYHDATVTGRMPPAHALATREILREIERLRVSQAPFGRIFWSLEQAIARLSDEIERRAS